MEQLYLRDIVCSVLANDCSKATIDVVLHEFIPDYERLNLDYAVHPHAEDYLFTSEEEMVTFFLENKGLNQTFYWNQYHNNPDKIMVGADITSDDKLIISLTMDGYYETAVAYYKRLEQLLQADIGAINVGGPLAYEDGVTFIEKCKNLNSR